jgi:hypothetical protein
MSNFNFIFLVNNFNNAIYQGRERRAPEPEYKEKANNVEGVFDTGRLKRLSR